ncbi:hypothetical protein [Cupriavidus basilensis]|uniref:Methyl-accepting chemotaxis protein, putative n=1 Tax=Cupriavidus basilensis TaxID=68895 RepID=A0A0C4YSU3_9BURK|nr:hypothetical protein [Cupriavidus basilensis]AJG25004.1 methyl-accepting chemotaxis protein, putative [Cupriavidus basilensis]
MKSIFDIRVQKLFLVTLILKVGSSFLGWKLRDPWILGFTVPLLIMGAYIALGYFRRENDLTDEKFADTCYYLGFIFTITSIIFSLFDLPNIGTRIQDIAVRFGAAMVSTVLGLGVRVYLVSFKKDVADAIKDAEDAVLDATRKFTEQLTIALERLRDFESQVDTAAKASVERVNMQVENLSKNHAEKLTAFFADLTTRNQNAFMQALGGVKAASQRLSDSVDGYSQGMRANLASIEAKVGAFTDAVTDRLKTTTFPDDYFAQHLSDPLAQLKASSTALAGGIKASFHEVNESTVVLSAALKKLKDKAGATEGSLETVLKLTQQQQAVLDTAQGQLTALEQLGATLIKFDETLASTLAGVAASNNATNELSARVAGVISDGAETRRAVESGLSGVIEKLHTQAQATQSVAAKIEANATATRAAAETISSKLASNTIAAETASTNLVAAAEASQSVVGKLESVAVADLKAVQTLSTLGQHATTAVGRVDQAVEQLQSMVRQLTSLDTALRAQSSELRDVVSRIQEVKVAVETPAPSTVGSPFQHTPALLSALSLPSPAVPYSASAGQAIAQPQVPVNGASAYLAASAPSAVGSVRPNGPDFGAEGAISASTQSFPPKASGT